MSERHAMPQPGASVSRTAAWSLGLAIGGLCCLGPIGSIPAIVLGHVARSSMRRNPGLLCGGNLAMAGLSIGYASLVLHAVLFAALAFSDQIAFRLKGVAQPLNYAFDLTVSDPSCPAHQVTPVLSSRLRDANVPHEVEVTSFNTITVKLATGQETSVDAERDLLTRPALLTFRMVHERNEQRVEWLFLKQMTPEGYRIVEEEGRAYYSEDPAFPAAARTREWRDRQKRCQVPDAGYELLLEKPTWRGRPLYRPFYVSRHVEVAGDTIKRAFVEYSGLGEPTVHIVFDQQGAHALASVTADYARGGARNPYPGMPRQLAIVLDETLYSAPEIREAIHGGRAVISGRFSASEALHLTALLRSGPLPCPLEITNERRLSP